LTVIFYASAEAPESTTNTTWTERASKQGLLRARKHWLWVYAEYGGIQIDKNVAIRVLINGEEVAGDYHQPGISNQHKSFSTMIEIEPLADESSYTVSLEYRAVGSPQTALVRRVRLMVMQE